MSYSGDFSLLDKPLQLPLSSKNSPFSKTFAQLGGMTQVSSLDMDSFDQNDPVWKTLEHASQKKASPYFVRKVLRSVREDARREPAFAWGTLLRWLVLVTACVVLAVSWPFFESSQSTSTAQTNVAQFNEYFDSAADLESLVATSDDVSNWIASQ